MAESEYIVIGSDTIRIGGAQLPGGWCKGGNVRVSDIAVRPLSLAERSRLLSSVSTDTKPELLSEMVARLAVMDGPVHNDQAMREEKSDRQSVAIQAVALYLAGAGNAGSLAETTLIAARALGSTVNYSELDAIEADRIARALTDTFNSGLSSQTSTATADTTHASGWTTISFDSPSALSPFAHRELTVEQVRDALAHNLLIRAISVIDPAIASAFLFVDETSAVHPPKPTESPKNSQLVSNETASSTDRWSAQRHTLSGQQDQGSSLPGQQYDTAVPEHRSVNDSPLRNTSLSSAQANIIPENNSLSAGSHGSTVRPKTTLQSTLPAREFPEAYVHPGRIGALSLPVTDMPRSTAIQIDSKFPVSARTVAIQPSLEPGAKNVQCSSVQHSPLRDVATGTVPATPHPTESTGSHRTHIGFAIRPTLTDEETLASTAAALHRAADLRGVPR